MYLQVRAGNQIDLADSCKLHLPKWVGCSPNQREGDPLMLEFPSAGLSNGLPTVLVEEGGLRKQGGKVWSRECCRSRCCARIAFYYEEKGERERPVAAEREGSIALLASEATSALNIVFRIDL